MNQDKKIIHKMTFQTDNTQLASLTIDAMYYYLGAEFMIIDNTGLTVWQVISEHSDHPEIICRKIAIMVLGGNLPHQIAKIKSLKFVKS